MPDPLDPLERLLADVPTADLVRLLVQRMFKLEERFNGLEEVVIRIQRERGAR